MAIFDTNGLDALIIDLDEIGEIDENTMWEMLEAGGEVIRKAHVEAIKQIFTHRTGKLEESPTVYKKMARDGDQRYVLVYPQGTHHTYRARGKTYTKMNWGRKGETVRKYGGKKNATNQDVAFVHEFGGHGNAPEQWMRRANEKHASEAVDAEAAVFYDWQKSHNL